MAERENTYPDGSYPLWTDYDWAQGPSGHTVTQPPAGKRQVGWDVNEIPPSAHKNDQFQRLGNALRYLGLVVPREFSTLAEAISEIFDSYIFRVHAPVGNWRRRGDSVFNTEGTGGAFAVLAMATDGERIYYGQIDYVYATSPASLTDEWSFRPEAGRNIIDLAADGLNVYALIGVWDPGDEVWLLDPATGTKNQGASIAGANCTCLDANGTFLVVAQTATVHFYNGLASGLATTGTFNNTQTITRLCIGNRRVYTVGAQGTGYPIIRAVDLVARTEDWNNGAWGASVPFAANWICTDGDLVYVKSNDVALTAGGTANLWAFRCQDGLQVWNASIGGDEGQCCVDDRLLWISDDNVDVYAVDKRLGFPLFKIASGPTVFCCDGLSVIGKSTNNVRRNWRGGPTRHFLRTNGSDDERRPFFNLAVPINEGV